MNGPTALDRHELELLNGGVDGELSNAEQKELRDLLARSAVARQFTEQLKSLKHAVEDLPEIEPPKYLQESIERQIRLPAPGEVAGERRSTVGNWLSAGWMRTGLALAAGVVLTITVYEMGSEPISKQDAANLVGTVVKSPVSAKSILLDRVDLTSDPVSGFVELHRAGDLFTLDVLLSSDEVTELFIDFADRGLSFEDMSSVPQQIGAVKLDAGTLSIAGDGERLYTLRLRSNTNLDLQQAAPLELMFFAQETLVQEAKVRIAQ